MYCPGCATQNYEDAKFCRVCGTNLVSVALALAEQSSTPTKRDANKLEANWTSHRRRCMKKFVEGGGLLAASAMLAVVLALFSNIPEWIIIWLVMVGWMAVIGVMSLAQGIGSLVESKFISRQLKKIDDEPAALTSTEVRSVAAPVTSPRLTPIPSVTENTTELLNERQQR